MAEPSRARAAVKLGFWTAAAAALFVVVAHSYRSGQMAAWYYHTAAVDGYAVDANTFATATREHPALLVVAKRDTIDGLVAVPVKKGDRLPRNANGVIGLDVIQQGKRVTIEGDTLEVMVPHQIQNSKGFKFKDTFKHKGVETYPWAAVWNVLITLGLGLTLGFMAEGFTDLLGVKLEKIRHFEAH